MNNTVAEGSRSPGDEGRGHSFVIQERRPLEVADEIKALFRAEGTDDFVDFFDRAYPVVEASGGTSVIGRDADGSVVMHVAVFPRTFRRGPLAVQGGLLGDLIVAERYRDFWSAVHFFQKAVDLFAASRRYDFLFTDPVAASFAVARAAGFDVLDNVRRFVMPLVPGWLSVLRLRLPVQELNARQLPWREGAALADSDVFTSDGAFRVVRSPAFYESRAWTQITDRSEWMAFATPGGGAHPAVVALLLTTPFPPYRAVSVMDVLWDERRVDLASVLYAGAAQARSLGFRKIAVRALDRSDLGLAIRRCGFVARNDDQPLLVKTLRDGVDLPTPGDWLLTWIDSSTW